MISSQEPLDTENLAPTILKNKEQRTKNKEQRTKNKEQRTSPHCLRRHLSSRQKPSDLQLPLPRGEFLFCKNSRLFFNTKLSRCVFGLWERSHGFLGVFLCFGSAPAGSLARFWASGALPRVRWRVFRFWERSRGFAGVFLGFGSIPTALLACFWVLGALPRIPRRVFRHWECSRNFTMALSACGAEII